MVLSARHPTKLKEWKPRVKISLSTHLFVFHALDEAIFPLFPAHGFSLAEIWAMPPHFPYDDPAAGDLVADGMAKHGVRVASLHAPLYPDVRTYKQDRWFSLSSLEEAHRLASVAAASRAAGWLARQGGGTMVVHTGFPAGDWYPHRWAAFLSSLNEMLETVPPSVRFAVENTPVDSGRMEVILDIVDRYPAERVGVCLDLGHAHIQENEVNAVRAAAARLIHVHASDNHAEHDEHLVPGRGSIAWSRVAGALQETGFDGAFTVELRDYTRGPEAPYNDFAQMLTECRGALARLLGERG
jgi:sugar phosphate isomerase/epimerase